MKEADKAISLYTKNRMIMVLYSGIRKFFVGISQNREGTGLLCFGTVSGLV